MITIVKILIKVIIMMMMMMMMMMLMMITITNRHFVSIFDLLSFCSFFLGCIGP